MTSLQKKAATYAVLAVTLVTGLYWFADVSKAASERDATADAAHAVEVAEQVADEAVSAVISYAEAAAGSGSFDDGLAFAEASASYFRDADSAAVTRAFGAGAGEFWEAARGAADALGEYEGAFVSEDVGDLREAVERQRGVVGTAEQMMIEIEARRGQLEEMTVFVQGPFGTDNETGLMMYEALDVGTRRVVVLLAAPGTIRPNWSGPTRVEPAGERNVGVPPRDGYSTEWRSATYPAYTVEPESDRSELLTARTLLDDARAGLRSQEEGLSALEARNRGPFLEAVTRAAEQIRAFPTRGSRPPTGP